MAIPTMTPPKAIPTEARDFMFHPSFMAELEVLLEPPEPPEPPDPPELPEPEGDEEVGTERDVVADGVNTPPEGS